MVSDSTWSNRKDVQMMFNCGNCIKSDVCGKKEASNAMLKDLELNKLVQALKGSGFKFDLECVNYAQAKATRVLGGQAYEMQ